MPTQTLTTSHGPLTVPATEPVPGLHVYEIPDSLAPGLDHRWFLTHHEGYVLASFTSEDAATTAAEKIAPLTDWTQNVMTTVNQLGPARAGLLLGLLREAGGLA
ncbi:hypothetical protein [Streptomyces sp. AD55]|uniref:hypothetical protein n=1 Tax=Streptomyces sp. AD55 TaxID=3242895 RepID=UPI00352879A7